MANAPASPFGWDFQFNSAIVLFIDYIKDIDFMRVEGEKEDVELHFTDGRIIFAQCKSNFTDEFKKYSSKYLIDAFRTLSEANNNPDCYKLLYVSNNPSPIGKKFAKEFPDLNCRIRFVDLPQDAQQYLNDLINKCGYMLDTNKLTIQVIGFVKCVASRHNVIKKHLDEFLKTLNCEYHGSLDMLHGKLVQEMYINSTSESEVTIHKKDLICLFIRNSLKQTGKYLSNLCLSDQNDFYKKYGLIIENKIIDYSFITKVFYDYEVCCKKYSSEFNKKYDEEQYIEDHWTEFSDQFLLQMSEKFKEALIKTILYTLFLRSREFEELKRAANL